MQRVKRCFFRKGGLSGLKKLLTDKRFAWLMSFLWMAVIFWFSAMPGDVSSEQSGTIVMLLTQLLSFLGVSPEAVDEALLSLLVRKAAHMTEYAVLLLLLRRALRLSGSRRPGLTALLLCALYAAGDEFHQSFTEGRGPSPVDVCIDTAGALLMWGLLLALECLLRRRR